MSNDKQNQTMNMADGRQLGYAEFGDPNGKPVFHFHGHGNSRFEGEMFTEKPKELGIRLIVPDRPGYGLSDFYKRKLLDWPDDVIALADYLKIDKFAVLGISGGCPHSLACAYKIPERLTANAVVSTTGPPGLGTKTLPRSLRLQMFSARRIPWLYRQMLKSQVKIMLDPVKTRKTFEKNAKRLAEADLRLISDDQFLEFFTRTAIEGARQGVDAMVYETKLFASPWGFDLVDIPPFQDITLWHGEEDHAFAVAKMMSKVIPSCKTRFIPKEGHVSIAVNYSDDLLRSLI